MQQNYDEYCIGQTGKKVKCTSKAARGCKYCKRHDNMKNYSSVEDLIKQIQKEERGGPGKRVKYRQLVGKQKDEARKYYERNTIYPSSKNVKFYDKGKNLVAVGYIRMVIGDHGAYLEFNKDQIIKSSLTPVSKSKLYGSQYDHWVSKGGAKVYHQVRTVKYANYKIGLYYIAPSELIYN